MEMDMALGGEGYEEDFETEDVKTEGLEAQSDEVWVSENKSGRTSKGRPKEWVWNYFDTFEKEGAGGQKQNAARCQLCSETSSPRCYVLKEHLITHHPEIIELAADCGESLEEDLDFDPLIQINASVAGKPLKRGRPKKWAWKNFDTVMDNESGKVVLATCKVCRKKVSPKNDRLEAHIQRYHSSLDESRDSDEESQTSEEEDESHVNSIHLETSSSTTKVRRYKRKDASWQYFNSLHDESGNKVRKVVCMFCNSEVSPKSNRMRIHLIRHHSAEIEEIAAGTGETETNPNPVGSGKPVGAEDLNSGTGTSYSSLQKPLRSEFGGKWVWGYFNTMRDAAGKKVVEALCKLCQTKVSPKNHRLTAHLEKAHWEEVPQLCGVRSSMYDPTEKEHQQEVPELSEIQGKSDHEHDYGDILQTALHSTIGADLDLEPVPSTSTAILNIQGEPSHCDLNQDRQGNAALPEAEAPPLQTSQKGSWFEKIVLDESDFEDDLVRQKMGRGRKRNWAWNHYIPNSKNLRGSKASCKHCFALVSSRHMRLVAHLEFDHPEVIKQVGYVGSGSIPMEKSCTDTASTLEDIDMDVRPGTEPGVSTNVEKDSECEESIPIPDETKIGRPLESAWNHFIRSGSKKIKQIRCKHCMVYISARHYRLRNHLRSHHPEIIIEDIPAAYSDEDVQFGECGTPEANDDDVENTEIKYEPDGTELVEEEEVPVRKKKTGRKLSGVWKLFKITKLGGRVEARCYKCKYRSTCPKVDRLKEHWNKHTDLGSKESLSSRLSSLRRRHSERQRSDLASKCLFCQGEVTISTSDPNQGTLNSWNENCASSLCNLLNLDPSFKECFRDARFCHSCLPIVYNIDFALRALNNLKASLNKSRVQVENLLQENYEVVVSNEDPLQAMPSSHASYYDATVKRIFETIKPHDEITFDPVIVSVASRSDSENKPVKFTRYGRAVSIVNFADDEEKAEESDRDPDYFLEADGDNFSETSSVDIPTTVTSVSESMNESQEKPLKKKAANKLRRRIKRPVIKSTRSHQRLVCTVEGCKFSFYKQKWLDIHIRSAHEGNEFPFHCEKCPMKLKNPTAYQYHLRRHADKPQYSCPTCSKSFFERWALKKHLNANLTCSAVDSPPNLTECTYCAKLCGADELEQHLELHKAKDAENSYFACVLCDKEFTNTLNLRHHVGLEHEEALPKCDQCFKTFKTEGTLKKHVDIVHSDQNSTYKCKECSYVGVKRSEFRRHVQTHRPLQEYQCEHCGKTYRSRSNLNIHMMLHKGSTPFQCRLCPKAFNQSCKLKAHEEIHAPTKTYMCEKCGKSFRTCKNLAQHRTYYCKEGPRLPHAKREKRKNHVRKSTTAESSSNTAATLFHESDASERDEEDEEEPNYLADASLGSQAQAPFPVSQSIHHSMFGNWFQSQSQPLNEFFQQQQSLATLELSHAAGSAFIPAAHQQQIAQQGHLNSNHRTSSGTDRKTGYFPH